MGREGLVPAPGSLPPPSRHSLAPACLQAQPYVDEVLIGATDDVMVGDRNGVDTPTGRLQDMHTLQAPDVPDLGGGRR